MLETHKVDGNADVCRVYPAESGVRCSLMPGESGGSGALFGKYLRRPARLGKPDIRKQGMI
jgi:hypothetical protein